MPNSKRLWTVLLFSCFAISAFLYSQTSSDKSVDVQTTNAKNSIPAELELKARVDQSFGKLPIRFEANVGQTDEKVKFLAREKGYSLFLTPQEAVMVLPIGPAKAASGGVPGGLPRRYAPRNDAASGEELNRKEIKKISLENDETRHAAIRMSLLNANPSPEMFGENEQITKSNYLIGNDPSKWKTDVSNFGRVRYEEAYPGLDLIYYGNPQQLEYDFIVSPDATPDVIKIKFEGQDAIEIDESGNLVLKAESGRIVQNTPVVYQTVGGERVAVEGRYVLLGEDSVGFKIGDYDREKDLVIDPSLVFSTFLGGSTTTEVNGIALASSGNIYVAGPLYPRIFRRRVLLFSPPVEEGRTVSFPYLIRQARRWLLPPILEDRVLTW